MNRLFEIAASTKERVEAHRAIDSLDSLLEQIPQSRTPHEVLSHFRKEGIHVIAEVKRSSPSLGNIAGHAVPLEVAKAYLEAGATAISVLTEPKYFGGDIAYLRQIRSTFPNSLLLMKDFVVDEYQLVQARLAGADMVLLIVSLLGEAKLSHYFERARQLKLTPLIEVHDEAEFEMAERLGADFIGVNNRNLTTLAIDIETSTRLASQIPANAVVLSESGLKTGEQIKRIRGMGYQGFLIGTSLMETASPGESLRRLLKDAV